MVEDGSLDNSWQMIEKNCKKDTRVKGIQFSRNFGQHYAITAGLYYAKGEWVVVMDCDLQDRPEEIPNLYAKAMEGYDIVYAKRVNRQDGFFKRISSSLFHSLFNWLSGMNTDKSISNFGIYSEKLIDEYNKMKEVARSFTSLIAYLGYKSCAIDVVHSERFSGKTSYTIRKLLRLSFDVIISNSNKPLRMAVKTGLVLSIVSFGLAFYNVSALVIGIIQVPGFTSTIFSIWFVGGLILSFMGILGLYIGKIFEQVKGRQIFIIKDMIHF